jgi:hypothetical protein
VRLFDRSEWSAAGTAAGAGLVTEARRVLRVATEMTNLDSTLEPGNGDELLQAVPRSVWTPRSSHYRRLGPGRGSPRSAASPRVAASPSPKRNRLRAPRTVARPHPPARISAGMRSALSQSPPPRARTRRRASPTTSSAPGTVTARSGSQRGAGSAGWRESTRQEREDWVTTVRAALSAGPDDDRDVAQRCRITIAPKVQPHHPTDR